MISTRNVTGKSDRQKNLTDDGIFQLLLMSAKVIFSLQNTNGSCDHSDDVISQQFLSRSISGVSFNFITCADLEVTGGRTCGCMKD